MNNNMVSIDVGYESFLAPEMFFHPVSLKNVKFFCRNLFIKTSSSRLRRQLMMLFSHVQQGIVLNCTTTLCCQAVRLCSRVLMIVCRRIFRSVSTQDCQSITSCQARKVKLSVKCHKTQCRDMLFGLEVQFLVLKTISPKFVTVAKIMLSMDLQSVVRTQSLEIELL